MFFRSNFCMSCSDFKSMNNNKHEMGGHRCLKFSKTEILLLSIFVGDYNPTSKRRNIQDQKTKYDINEIEPTINSESNAPYINMYTILRG